MADSRINDRLTKCIHSSIRHVLSSSASCFQRRIEFWDKIDYNSTPAKDNCTLFSATPYFQARAMQWYHVNFFPVVMATSRFYKIFNTSKFLNHIAPSVELMMQR